MAVHVQTQKDPASHVTADRLTATLPQTVTEKRENQQCMRAATALAHTGYMTHALCPLRDEHHSRHKTGNARAAETGQINDTREDNGLEHRKSDSTALPCSLPHLTGHEPLQMLLFTHAQLPSAAFTYHQKASALL